MKKLLLTLLLCSICFAGSRGAAHRYRLLAAQARGRAAYYEKRCIYWRQRAEHYEQMARYYEEKI